LPKENYITASCVIAEHAVFQNNQQIFENKAANVESFLVAVYQNLNSNYPKFYKMDNLSKLGWLAAEVLLANGFEKEKYEPQDIALIIANKNSSLDTDIKYFETVKTIASPALFVYTLPNIVMGEICIRNNFKGENAFFIFERFNPGFMQQYVQHLFDTDAAKAVICGWIEIMNNDYKAALYLVENGMQAKAVPFTSENINHIYQITNG
jgi:hypothetical protein